MRFVRGDRFAFVGGSLMCQGKIGDALPWDTGYVSSRTCNGWLRVHNDRTKKLIWIRNIHGSLMRYEDYRDYRDAPDIARHFIEEWFNLAVFIADQRT